jgi:hypothetical protein
MMCWRSPWQARGRGFAFSASPADPIPGSSRNTAVVLVVGDSATPCHAMPGPVRSTVGAFLSGCPLIHARLRQACMQHRAGGVPTARCDAYYPYIHEIASTSCVCFAAARRRRPCARGVACGAEGGRAREASLETRGRAVC